MVINGFGILKNAARLSIYLVIAACSQPIIETYGCACASREYTQSEIAAYRVGAAKNDLKSLAELQEYYMWREDAKQERAYLDRRLALGDEVAIEEEVNRLIDVAVSPGLVAKIRENALIKARDLARRHDAGITVIDLWNSKRTDIDAVKYLDREIALARKQGDSYHAF